MKIQMIPVIYDDDNNECRIGDTLIIRTKKITEPSVAKIKNIATTYVTLVFDDPMIGFQPINIRVTDFTECKAYR